MDESTTRQELQRTTATVKTLLNNELKILCRTEGLTVTGVKAALQTRILDRLKDLHGSGDYPRFFDLCNRIRPRTSAPTHASSYPAIPRDDANHAPVSNGFPTPQAPMTPNYAAPSSRLMFPESPFYTISRPLTGVVDMQVASSTRQTATATISLSQADANNLKTNSNMRILLYCSGHPYGAQPNDIAFPAQVEIKVNGELYAGNTRGIKKKPGTTRPADITAFIKKQSMFSNSVIVTYAATEKKFAFIIHLVRKHSPEELADRIKKGHVLSKQQVLNEMISKAKDPDVVATSSVMSLRCPISAMRMQLPCRSTICTHVQCFDATSFLQAQEQAPQWTCPTCSKRFAFQALVVDQYVQDILRSTSTSVDQVTIEPTGGWRPGTNADDFRKPEATNKPHRPPEIAHDDFLEISDYRINGIKSEAPLTPLSFTKPSNLSSREPSSGPARSGAASGSKRSADEVIDLTLSDDDDPPRPVKRQSTGNLPSLHRSVSAHVNDSFMGSAYDTSAYSSSQYNQTNHSYSFSMPQRSNSNQNTPQQYQGYGYGLPGRRF
ncbi:MAG: SUMO ligase siz1 [Chrysothrix sp. TS-e1954]|nr:MAG: SUMO ligase siz1 [Chrysothrix sp. TS-e1954]